MKGEKRIVMRRVNENGWTRAVRVGGFLGIKTCRGNHGKQ